MSQVNLNGAAAALLQGLGLGEQVRSNRDRMLFAQQQAAENTRLAGVDDMRQREALDLQRQQFNQRIRELDDQRVQDETRKAANARAFQYLSDPNDAGADLSPDFFGQMSPEVASKYAAERGNRADYSRGAQEWDRRIEEARKDRSIAAWSPKMWEEAQKYGKFPQRGDMPKSTQQQKAEEENATKMRILSDIGITPTVPTPYGPQPNREFEQYANLSLDYLKEIIARKRKEIDAEEAAAQQAATNQAAVAAAPSVGLRPEQVRGSIAMRNAGIPFTPQAPEKMDQRAFARAGISDRKLALDALEAQWKPYIDPVTGGPTKGASRAAGVDTGWFKFDGEPTPEYIAAQKAYQQWQALQSEQIGAATGLASGGAQPQPVGGQDSLVNEALDALGDNASDEAIAAWVRQHGG